MNQIHKSILEILQNSSETMALASSKGGAKAALPSFVKFILLLFLLTAYTQAGENIVNIDANFTEISSPDYIYYINDKNNTYSPSMILHSKVLKQTTKMHIGSKNNPFWTRVRIKNRSDKIQNLSLFNPLAGIAAIDVYIYKDDTLIKSHSLGDMREQSKREVVTRLSMFNLTLLAGESVVVVSKIENYMFYNIGLSIQKSELFMEDENYFIFSMAFWGGIGTFILIVIFAFFIMYKQKAYLLLSLYFSMMILYEYSFHGILYLLDIGINLKLISILPWLSHLSGMMLIILFASFLFNIKESYPKIYIFMNIMLYMPFIVIVLYLYSIFIYDLKDYFTNDGSYITFFILLSLGGIGIYMLIKKEIGAKYYLIGHGTFLLALFVNSLGLYGTITYHEALKLLIPMALLVDVLFLLIAQYLKTYKAQLDLLKNRELLLEQSRFISIGQAIGNITHQWKQPLAKLGSSVTYLEAILKNDAGSLERVFYNKLPNLTKNITQMQHTIDDFSNYYATTNQVEKFYPKEILNRYVMEILNSKVILKNVAFKLEIDDAFELHCYEHIFSNIMMILIDNSLDSFQSNTLDNQITISINKHKNYYQIEYSDNAGGIKIKPIEKIFEYFISSKEDTNTKGHGMGLAIAKMLVEDRLKGKISVENIDNGVLFRIIFN